MSIEDRVQQLVEDFVAKMASLAREAAMETLAAHLSADGDGAPPRRPRAQRAPKPVVARRARKGSKRPAADIARLEAQLAKHIAKYPGQRVEQINKVLGTQTSDVRLPLAKLIAAGTVKTKGTRRATAYFPG